jgi:eukaryotic-like serine/threonine-protein kinase
MGAETTREQELFEAALSVPGDGKRAAFLDQACDGDPELRSRLSKLLAAHDHTEVFFQKCISDIAKAVEEMPPVSSGDAFQSLS